MSDLTPPIELPKPGAISKKPPHLVVLESIGKGKGLVHFVTTDRPEIQPGFILVKGFYTELSEDELAANYAEVFASTPKDKFLDMMFPWHRVLSCRNLVFNPVKPVTAIKQGY